MECFGKGGSMDRVIVSYDMELNFVMARARFQGMSHIKTEYFLCYSKES